MLLLQAESIERAMNSSIYNVLLTLPLFQGLTKNEFGEIIEKIRFDFSTVEDGVTFIKAGDVCDGFVFILNGTAISKRTSSDGRFVISETVCAPTMLEAYSMYGFQPSYVKDYTANGSVGLLRFDKQYLYSELYKYNICRMNLLNMLSGRIQNLEADMWRLQGGCLRERIVRLVSGLCDSSIGRKEVRVKMDDLSGILCETRLNVSRALNSLEDEHKIILRRGGFDIPSMEGFTNEIM